MDLELSTLIPNSYSDVLIFLMAVTRREHIIFELGPWFGPGVQRSI